MNGDRQTELNQAERDKRFSSRTSFPWGFLEPRQKFRSNISVSRSMFGSIFCYLYFFTFSHFQETYFPWKNVLYGTRQINGSCIMRIALVKRITTLDWHRCHRFNSVAHGVEDRKMWSNYSGFTSARAVKGLIRSRQGVERNGTTHAINSRKGKNFIDEKNLSVYSRRWFHLPTRLSSCKPVAIWVSCTFPYIINTKACAKLSNRCSGKGTKAGARRSRELFLVRELFQLRRWGHKSG